MDTKIFQTITNIVKTMENIPNITFGIRLYEDSFSVKDYFYYVPEEMKNDPEPGVYKNTVSLDEVDSMYMEYMEFMDKMIEVFMLKETRNFARDYKFSLTTTRKLENDFMTVILAENVNASGERSVEFYTKINFDTLTSKEIKELHEEIFVKHFQDDFDYDEDEAFETIYGYSWKMRDRIRACIYE